MERNLQYIVDHVFLPPKLPREEDSSWERCFDLTATVLDALNAFGLEQPQSEQPVWATVARMIQSLQDSASDEGTMSAETIGNLLMALLYGDTIALHIVSQNAGLLIRRIGNEYVFESSELAPTTKAVMGTKGRLIRCFPGPAVAISRDRVLDSKFRKVLTQCLADLNNQTIAEATPTTQKAGNEVVEIRDSIDPKFVTEMLTGILRGIGRTVDIERIHKRTRDDILWHDTLTPWRRSRRWLLIRVSLQTSLATGDASHHRYKAFMIFFMARVLKHVLTTSLPSDTLFIMAAKITRRILKLGAFNETAPWVLQVYSTVNAAQRKLQNRWNAIEQPKLDHKSLDVLLEPIADSHSLLTAETLKDYVANVVDHLPPASEPRSFIPNCLPRTRQTADSLPPPKVNQETAIWLADTELWVRDCLNQWLEFNISSEYSCINLLVSTMDNYIRTAELAYENDPEDFSTMVLTIMELWIALDKCATFHLPLLKEYSAGFPPSLFEPLLLPKKQQMDVLSMIEQYLAGREGNINPTCDSIFEKANTPTSFAVRFFDQSVEHQSLKLSIERAAQKDRNAKLAELATKQHNYKSLIQSANSKSCEFINVIRGKKRKRVEALEHSSQCQKCQLNRQAHSMKISIHEWPLPSRDLEARAAVFELKVPNTVSKWRDMTYRILVDILSPELSRPPIPDKVYTLRAFIGVQRYIQNYPPRLQLASREKSFSQAHYSEQAVSVASESNICVDNGLRCTMFDDKAGVWAAQLMGQCSIRQACMLTLPSGPYKALQFALEWTHHTSNQVLSRQADCPQSLNLHEFYAFASLRSGNRLQWRNIARELVTQILNFSHDAIYQLLAQTAWQAGPSSPESTHRDSHADLGEREFGQSLLSALNVAVARVESNWQGAPAARALTLLAARLLSSSPHWDVRDGCLKFLDRVRAITLGWTHDVLHLMHESEKESDLNRLGIQALEMALTCHGTFDVDSEDLNTVLNSTEAVSIITECMIITRDRCPLSTEALSSSLRVQLRRSFRISHRVEAILRRVIILASDGIDKTVAELWGGYKPETSWAALVAPRDRWLTTKTFTDEGHLSKIVHFNLLDGSLLVDGLPLMRLPEKYERHTTYRRLFGEKVLEVVPSSVKGMAFETRKKVNGHQIHFAMYEDELIVKTCRDQFLYDHIPPRALRGDFPEAFISDHVHWLESDGSLEFRPLISPWISSSRNWKTSSGGGVVNLVKGPTQLVDIRSPLAQTISEILSPLESKGNIHIMFNGMVVEIHLPRFNLDFVLQREGSSLESKQFRGMVVDSCQSFGSLSGLSSKLVLREIKGSSRIVLVPDGRVSFESIGDHLGVFIETGDLKLVRYHQFQIDTQLGRLVDNGSLLSRLFKIYLHALTSYCLPDSLTGRTGTEEALHGLSAASTQSFLELRLREVDILELIAELTPLRVWYPKHLNVMQDVKWSTLSPLSQHEGFCRAVESIMSRARSLRLFHDSETDIPKHNTRGFPHLHDRASIRNSSFRVYDYGAEAFSTNYDTIYQARDQIRNSARELQACTMSNMVDTWSPNIKVAGDLLNEMESWCSSIDGIAEVVDTDLGFNQEWLDPPSSFLPHRWCTLHSLLSTCDRQKDKYRIMFFLATLAYSKYARPKLVQALLAFATVDELHVFPVPQFARFDIAIGYQPDKTRLTQLVASHFISFQESPESRLPRLPQEREKIARKRREAIFGAKKVKLVKEWVDHMVHQWPATHVVAPDNPENKTYIEAADAIPDIREVFQSWHRNMHFKTYVSGIQMTMDIQPDFQTPLCYSVPQTQDQYSRKKTHIKFEDLLSKPAPIVSQSLNSVTRLNLPVIRAAISGRKGTKLEDLLANLSAISKGGYEKSYITDLQSSYDALNLITTANLRVSPRKIKATLEAHLEHCRGNVRDLYQTFCFHLQPPSTLAWDFARRLWMMPRLSPSIILSHLARYKSTNLSVEWSTAILGYGLAIADLQQAERLVVCSESTADLLSELLNPGHVNWNPMEHPDWLLLELENGILIREEQAQIAKQMISPSSGSNSLMQLNMGLGKSSVIVPIVATALADGTKLARVVVLKSLSMQMFQLLLNKLGGLLNRRIFYLPISRSLRVDNIEDVRCIQQALVDCMETGGVLLVQPEHILSFELLGLDRLLSNDPSVENQALGEEMVNVQHWLHANARDILDESDEILSVRFELIYTMGLQAAIDYSPNRWVIIQQVLEIIAKFTGEVAQCFHNGLEVLPKVRGFPRIRILQAAAGNELLKRAAEEICKSGLPGLPTWNLPHQARSLLLRFLTDSTMTEAETFPLQNSGLHIDIMANGLLLLRGLFANGILNFVFGQKRWRVNYGLDLPRTKLAVPYHAKDSPSARSEFSHPDTAIILTCLSYYYGGLSDKQLSVCFEKLLKSDNSQEEYKEWIQNLSELPATFQQLSGINLSNISQCSRDVFPHLRFSKGVIDYYMSYLVFPKEMKEFPHKLSSSGWDLGRDKGHPTTGFSGTNDSKYILPLPVSQCDMPQQLSTNASVLDCLLRPENSFDKLFSCVEILDAEVLLQVSLMGYILPNELSKCRLMAFLKMTVKATPPVRVILDVGAQVLELHNDEVARKWLKLVSKKTAPAVIYFDSDNELCVLNRKGLKELLLVSPYAKQMDSCLIYLDEAHTRGTDLKMPADYRAMVTLGPDLTKDRLVQACMRMRKLGKGQSVVFCGSIEVQLKILASNNKKPSEHIEVSDVLSWCIQNTWVNTKKSIPLWATQGIRHYRRRAACSKSNGLPLVSESILEPESQTLQQRYGYGGEKAWDALEFQGAVDKFTEYKQELDAIRSKCREFGLLSFGDSALQEEQERELQPENEREQQVERPAPVVPHLHKVHPKVREFVVSGVVNRFSDAFQPAFSSLVHTSARASFEPGAWPEDLLVTKDFSLTVNTSGNQSEDSFLRPVHWILSGKYGNQVSCIILSPHEANELMPLIRQYKKTTLHVYAPRLSLSHRNLGDLSFCAIPPVPRSWKAPSLTTQINLFAGRLYISNFAEYMFLCQFLGLCSRSPADNVRVGCDGFINPQDRALVDRVMARHCRFQISPLAFLRTVMALRRKNQSFGTSHMGRLLNGELLMEENFRKEDGADESEPTGVDSADIIDLTGGDDC